MNDSFEIPVTFNGAEISFPAQLIPSGYIHKIQVDVYGQPFLFEPDEEGQYIVVIDPAVLNTYKNIDIALLREIANVLQSVNESS